MSSKRVARRLGAAALLLALAAPALQALPVPPLRARINDRTTTGVLSPAAVARLEAMLKEHERATADQVALLILSSLEGESLEEYSHRVASQWRLGQKGKDNGVLLLIAIQDRKLRIEVGYGLEAKLPDGLAGRIIREKIAPRFRSNDIEGGVSEGLSAIVAILSGKDPQFPPPAPSGGGGLDGGVVVFFVILLVVLFIALSRGGGGGSSGWSSSDWSSSDSSWSSSDSFSGGGGSFGGGGASGSW